jgi:hypothetical protein
MRKTLRNALSVMSRPIRILMLRCGTRSAFRSQGRQGDHQVRGSRVRHDLTRCATESYKLERRCGSRGRAIANLSAGSTCCRSPRQGVDDSLVLLCDTWSVWRTTRPVSR